ncbi:MAG: hypothetical protein QXW65_02145 [Candidatus Pacearchaeota archaeon]
MKIEKLKKRIENLEEKIKKVSEEREDFGELREEFIKEKVAEAGKKIVEKYFSQEAKQAFYELYNLYEGMKTRKPEYLDEEGNIKIEIYNRQYKLMKKYEDLMLNELAKAASDEEKIIGAYYLSDVKAIIGGCSGFGFHKDPSTCSGCVAGQKTASVLGIKKYYEYLGDRTYQIPEKTKIKSLEKLLGIDVENELKKIRKSPEKELKKLEAKREYLEKKLNAYEILNSSGIDYEAIEEKMPEFFNEIINARKEKSSVQFATASIKDNVGVILIDEWNYYGSGGCEYGVTARAFRDGKTKDEYFKYRDPYDPQKDDWRYRFDKAEIVKVTKDKVTIKLINTAESFSIERTFDLPKSKKKLESILSESEQKKFISEYEKIEKKLLESHYRSNARMPDYVAIWGFQGPVSVPITGRLVPYEQPEVIDRYIDAKKGVAALVIKAQIDHCAGRGKQYAWIGYVINKKGEAKQVYYDTAYQIQLKEGKRIEVKARDLLKRRK